MTADAVDGTAHVSNEDLRRTQQLLDTGFDEFDVADLLEAHAELVLDLTQQINQLAQSLESRTVIGQALGICIERYNINEEQAFQFLVRISQQHNVKLRDVAARLVEATVQQNGESTND